MTTFFTADTHFGHANIIKYCDRPFQDVDAMNKGIIARWVATVAPADIVYHLGDFAFLPVAQVHEILDQLTGKIHLIAGNHDRKILGDKTLSDRFASVSVLTELSLAKKFIVLCHYPLLAWNRSNYGSTMFHGHSHGKSVYPNPQLKILDVGVDCHGYVPVAAEELDKKITQRINSLSLITPES